MAVEVHGLAEFAAAARRIDPRLARELSKAHKQVSTEVAERAQRNVSGLPSPQSSRAAAGVRPRAGQTKGSLALLGSNPFVRAAVFGTVVHHVFGRSMRADRMARRVWQQHVGAWTAEEGLYGVSPAIKQSIPDILDTYGDRIMVALKEMFPD